MLTAAALDLLETLDGANTPDAEGAFIPPLIVAIAYRLGLIAYPLLQSCAKSPSGGACGTVVSLANKAVKKYCSSHKC